MTTSSPMYLVSQACQPETVAESGSQVSEAMRLRSALTWAYEFIVYQYEQPYAFSAAIYYNGDAIDSANHDAETQFEVLEETDGSEANLVVRAIAGRCSMESVEVVPVDSTQQPIDFTVVDLSAAQRTLSYAKDSSNNYLKFRMTGLNVLHTNAAQACVQSIGGTPVCFSAPLLALVERRDNPANSIRVDELGDVPAEARSLEDHLTNLFNILLAGVSKCVLGVQCDYSYPLAETGTRASIPVFLLPPQVNSSTPDSYAGKLANSIKQVFGDVRPPLHGTLMFRVKCYRSEEANEGPSLVLEGLLLDTDRVTNLQGSA